MNSARRFQLHIDPDELDQLRTRLSATRWPQPIPAEPWAAGTDERTLRRLIDYWRDGFDWRAQEAAINELPHCVVELDGQDVHFLHFRGEGERPLPIVLTHGWPSSFLEMRKLAPLLAYPSRFGGSPSESFDVVVPSLPGYPFSAQRAELGTWTHTLWHRLMHEVLGYEHYAAHGGDLGAGVTTRLGWAYPESVLGIHLLAAAPPPPEAQADLSDDERAHLEELARWEAEEGGYQHEQSTRPVTLGYALSDSPVGLLAWIVEKYRSWSDCGGELSRTFSGDDVLTQASLYWLTNSTLPSFRPYYEYVHCRPPHPGPVQVPTAVALFPKDLAQPPRSWVERNYNLVRFNRMPRGGHFAAHEQPGLLAQDIREFFAALRSN